MHDIFTLSIMLIVFILFLTVFVLIYLRLRKRGGSLTSVLFGAVYEFYNRDQRKAVEQVVEHKSEKKQTDQDTSEPEGDQEKFEQYCRHESMHKVYPGMKNLVLRFTPRKLMRR